MARLLAALSVHVVTSWNQVIIIQPILLLDDVSSELDPSRNQYLFEHLATQAGQCFITTTDGRHVLLDRDRADYRIRNGEISS